ncbi:unnamed protein product, partial [Pylaiella littoralis]
VVGAKAKAGQIAENNMKMAKELLLRNKEEFCAADVYCKSVEKNMETAQAELHVQLTTIKHTTVDAQREVETAQVAHDNAIEQERLASLQLIKDERAAVAVQQTLAKSQRVKAARVASTTESRRMLIEAQKLLSARKGLSANPAVVAEVKALQEKVEENVLKVNALRKSKESARLKYVEACVIAGKPADTLGAQLTPPQLEQRARGGQSQDPKFHLQKNDDTSEYTIPKKVPIQTRQVFNESVYERLEQQYPDLDGAALGDMYLKEVAAASVAHAQETARANKKAAFQAQVRLGMQPSAAVAPVPQVAQTEVGLGQVEESPFPSRGGGGGGNQNFSPRGRGGGRFFGGRGGGRFNRGNRFQGGNRGYGGEGSHHYGPQEQAFPFDQPMKGDSRTVYGYPPAHEGERTKR